ncbi:response regulator transcription factor [Fusibacter bizertensis]|jgi:Response regulators consisting of a CheY-like receiver domain and a winged-helix DNA-binding domain|uniref:Stage 0 sporulation protein A homolog n=1 Tax=Fusibacter bizertensis TaxID=1488331 RepID=A0ABT6NAA2_9FIRM|nr:response regulator transcription factor [Fusibacter bizertensis]MDH8677348.1 response regulator transcription factor [Fusibacter bizertensis]
MYKILIVEDDPTISKALQTLLENWDYEVLCCKNFKDIMSDFISFEPHLVLLDISLPYYNGYHWCATIRAVSKVPILFISSASDNLNIVMAMNMGADDFISKPFDFTVLVAKIQAVLRRAYSFTGQTRAIEHTGVILNLNDTTVSYKDQKIELTKNDFRILQMLMENAGKVVSRNDLMTRLWESDEFVDDNTLTVNVTRLRKKLEEIELYDWIGTKKGMGYWIE